MSFLLGNAYAQLLAQTADLKCVYTKGDTYFTTIQSSQIAEVMGMELPQEMIVEADMEILEVSKTGEAIIKMTYSRVKFEQDNPMAGKGIYDSDLEEQSQDELSQMFQQMFSVLVGKSLTFKVDNRGEFLGVLEGDPALKSSFENQTNAFHSYPDKPLKIGESWKTQQKQGSGEGIIFINNTFTLKGKEGNQWIVEVVSSLENEAGEEIGDSKGELKIQAENAFIAQSTVAQNIEKMKANGVDVSVRADNTTTTTKK